MEYTARGSRTKGFVLNDAADNILGNISYANWFTRKANLQIHNEDHYEIAPTGFWRMNYDIIRAEYKTGEIRRDWRGRFSISLNGKHYEFKRNSFRGRTFLLQSGGRQLFLVRQRFEWSKLGFRYEIQNIENGHDADTVPMLLLAVFCLNQQYSGAGAT